MSAATDTPATALAAFGVDTPALDRALSAILGREVDDADLYFERTVSESLSLEEGLVKRTSRGVHQGVGVRAIAGERTGYAHSDDITPARLLEAAHAARAIARERDDDGTGSVALAARRPGVDLYPVSEQPVDVPLERKLELLQAIDEAARAEDAHIDQVFASIVASRKQVAIVDAKGRVTHDDRPLVRLNVTCIAVDGTNRQVGSSGGGGRWTFETLLEDDLWREHVAEAARRAVLLLRAEPSPAGEMDVVLGPGWPGILLHEAIGHGLEGDFNRKGTSAFAGRVGTKVASPLVTVVDDGTIPQRRGSLNVDDEGTPTSRTTLIRDGVLEGYMQDKLNARLMGVDATGNGRRQSFAHVPMPRMTNTFMLAGDSDPEEIIRSVDNGVYAVSFGGGQVDITSGKFVFTGSEAYRIEGGKITTPLKGATFIGNGPDVLTRVTAVGHDLQLDKGVGTCGKEGQSVPVGVGMPTIRIDGLTVGGTGG